MSMGYIRETYRVPAKRGMRVMYNGDGNRRLGTITRADGQYLRIRLDGERRSGRYHPAWKLTYMPAVGKGFSNHG